MDSPFKNVGLFGANGQMGLPVLEALVNCRDAEFNVTAFISPGSTFDVAKYPETKISVRRVDLDTISVDDLAHTLSIDGIDVVLSALGGKIIAKQILVQDAAAKAGVRRFYPSEFGMHQVIWLPNGDAYIHPVGFLMLIGCSSNSIKVWALKMKCLQDAIMHPAIKSGAMTYTVIGCTECYDAPDEPLFCPWLEKDYTYVKDGYTIYCVGNADAQMDYCSRIDIANFIVATLLRPAQSENQVLGFRSDHISFSEVAQLLRRYSGRPVKIVVISPEQMQEMLDSPSLAPVELQRNTTFPLNFFLVLRYVIGQGIFYRPPGMLHNVQFPEVKTTTVDQYFAQLFEGVDKSRQAC